MINFSIDYLTRKDEQSSEEGSPGSSPVTHSDPDNFNVNGAPSLSPTATATSSGAASKDKPGHSYIALISMAILESTEKKVLLGDIYSYIMTKFPYYNNQDKAWKNSIRHNLSLNECFIKNGRAENGKGNYWSIHPACLEDFSKGDFRRRQARRRARKSAMTDVTSSSINMAYRSSLEYIPMSSSSLTPATLTPTTNYQPMPNVPVQTTTAPNMLSSAFMYPALMSSTSNTLPYDNVNNGTSMIYPSFMTGTGYPSW